MHSPNIFFLSGKDLPNLVTTSQAIDLSFLLKVLLFIRGHPVRNDVSWPFYYKYEQLFAFGLVCNPKLWVDPNLIPRVPPSWLYNSPQDQTRSVLSPEMIVPQLRMVIPHSDRTLNVRTCSCPCFEANVVGPQRTLQ